MELCQHTARFVGTPNWKGTTSSLLVVTRVAWTRGAYQLGLPLIEMHLWTERQALQNLGQGCSPWKNEGSDPIVVLSTYSLERMRQLVFKERVELFPNAAVTSVAKDGEGFVGRDSRMVRQYARHPRCLRSLRGL